MMDPQPALAGVPAATVTALAGYNQTNNDDIVQILASKFL